jgi:hypothetical protein
MEMRRAVIVEEHRDDDPEKTRDCGHDHAPVERSGQQATTATAPHIGPWSLRELGPIGVR